MSTSLLLCMWDWILAIFYLLLEGMQACTGGQFKIYNETENVISFAENLTLLSGKSLDLPFGCKIKGAISAIHVGEEQDL